VNAAPPRTVISRHTVHAANPPQRLRAENTLAGIVLAAFSGTGLMLLAAFVLIDWSARRSAMVADAEVLATAQGGVQVRYVDAQGVARESMLPIAKDATPPAPGQRLRVLHHPHDPALVSDADRGPPWPGLIAFAALLCLPLAGIAFLRRQALRQERRYARLRLQGRRHPVEAVRVQRVPWGKWTRWTLVASWRDAAGVQHETFSGPYGYEPRAPDPATLQVIADGFAPDDSILDPDTLPPFSPPRSRRSR
jgi:hypothetical protein